MKKIPVALQLWSVRDDMRRDFAATAAAVARIGYRGVELAGYGNLDVVGVKAALDAAGLLVAGMHVGSATLRGELDVVINDALLLGARHVTCPSWPAAEYVSAAACEKIGEQLDAVGASLRTSGIRFSFHNHAHELKVIDGRTVFDWMLGAAQPRNLAAEPDVYWLHVGGCPPGKFLRDHGARCPLIHMKDEMELGRGPVDFADVFDVVDDVGAAEWFIVEQESYSTTPLAGVTACFEQLKAWGRA